MSVGLRVLPDRQQGGTSSQTSLVSSVYLETKDKREFLILFLAHLTSKTSLPVLQHRLHYSDQAGAFFFFFFFNDKSVSQEPVTFCTSPFGLEFIRLVLSPQVIFFFLLKVW